MGVYIKIQKPEHCDRCFLISGCSYCEGFHDHCALEPDEVNTEWDFDHDIKPENIPDWCPLISVSHHGRLIDAEKLIAELKNPPLHRSLAGMCMDDVIGMINDAPTVIPAEEE